VPKPFIAARRPVTLELQPGTYRWCSCGRSEDQPWCDDSHRGSEFEPIVFTITERKRVSMCQCKHTTKAPFCSGVHGDIPW
jgi:CDGSH iron-sulfur domain-containing protein 3